MYLDRSLIKSQAKELIRGKVFKLFLVIFVVTLCVSFLSGIGSGLSFYLNENGNMYDDFFNEFDDNYDDDGYGDDFDNFGDDNSLNGSDFYNFGKSRILPSAYVIDSTRVDSLMNIARILNSIGNIVSLIMMPLTVTLAAYFVMLIRGKNEETDAGIKWVFKNTFDGTFGKKFCIVILRNIFIALLSLLFLIPGIIFSYSSYFAFQIVCDNPELGPMDAIKLSKKIIKGNRTELFLLDLSFIPWVLLCIFIFPLIYVLPYIYTTTALYYENFRIRALQQGRVTEDDFLSQAQRMMKYSSNQAAQNQYYTPNANQYQQGNSETQQNQYYNPAGTQPQYYNPAQPPYTPPAQEEQPAAPAQPAQPQYTEPQEPEKPEYYEPQEPSEPEYTQPQEPQEPQESDDPQE